LGDAFAEALRDGRGEPGVDVCEAALPGVAFGGGVKSEKPVPAVARRAGVRIEKQVGFGGETKESGAEDGGIAD